MNFVNRGQTSLDLLKLYHEYDHESRRYLDLILPHILTGYDDRIELEARDVWNRLRRIKLRISNIVVDGLITDGEEQKVAIYLEKSFLAFLDNDNDVFMADIYMSILVEMDGKDVNTGWAFEGVKKILSKLVHYSNKRPKGLTSYETFLFIQYFNWAEEGINQFWYHFKDSPSKQLIEDLARIAINKFDKGASISNISINAISILGLIRNKDSIAQLKVLSDSEDKEVREEALDQLSQITNDAL